VEAVQEQSADEIKNNSKDLSDEDRGHGSESVSPQRRAASLRKARRRSSNLEKGAEGCQTQRQEQEIAQEQLRWNSSISLWSNIRSGTGQSAVQ